MGAEVPYRGQTGQGVKLPTHLQLVLGLKMSGAVPLLFTPTFVAYTTVTSHCVTSPISYLTVRLFWTTARIIQALPIILHHCW